MNSKFYHIILFLFVFHFCFAKDITPPAMPKLDYITVNPLTNFIDVYWLKSPSPGFAKDTTVPVLPKLDYITVNPVTNFIDVYWLKSPSPDVSKYIVQSFSSGIYWSEIDSTNNFDSLHYTITKIVNPDKKPAVIVVAAQDSSFNLSAYTLGHSSIYLSFTYDTCENIAQLKWTPYLGWTSVESYEIWSSSNNSAFSLFQKLSSTDSIFVPSNLSDTTEYCFYVVAVRSDGIRSLSNKKCFTTVNSFKNMIINPIRIYPTNDQKQWQFKYKVDPSVDYLNYNFTKTANLNDTFYFIANSKIDQTNLIFYDTLKNVADYYKIVIKSGNCRQTILESNPLQPIIIKGVKELNNYAFSWDFYPIKNYLLNEFQLYIEDPEIKKEVYATVQNNNYYLDYTQLGDYSNSQTICFNIEAHLSSTKDTSTAVVVSNQVCFIIDTEIIMPEGFTPNNDGKNDDIYPRFNRIPLEYAYTVSDRWGKKMFESRTLNQGWDGSSGKAPEGIYIYQVKGIGFNGKKFDKVGYFSLIFP